jgi:hypothetical protein
MILHEDFEAYQTTKALRAAWPAGPGQLVTNAPGGGHAAAHDGTSMNRRSGFFVYPDATHNVVLSADFYDFGTNTDQNVTVSVNDEEGHQNIAMGLKGTSCYVVRVGGFGSQTNWVPFKRGQTPVAGWHRFKAIVSTTNVLATLDLQSDGEVDYILDIPFKSAPPTFTQVRFGGYWGRLAGGGTVLVDNIKLELLSIPSDALVSTAGASTGTNLAQVPIAVSSTNPVSAKLVGPSVATPPLTRQSDLQAPERTAAPLISAASSAKPATVDFAAHPDSSLPTAVYWICAALCLIIVLLVSLMLTLRRHTALLPKALLAQGSGVTSSPGSALITKGGPDDDWRQRALEAEALAAKQAQVLGEKVGPELVEFAKQTLVQGLYTQRNELMETQDRARQTLMELESRLSELHLPAQERIRAYEKRIGELEQELQSRSIEMRELTQATLLLVRQRLDQERVQQQHRRFN